MVRVPGKLQSLLLGTKQKSPPAVQLQDSQAVGSLLLSFFICTVEPTVLRADVRIK